MKLFIVKYGSKKYYHFLKLRIKVFCKEQKIDLTLEQDKNEKEAIYFLAFSRFFIISGARLRKTEKGYKIERMLTRKKYRHKGNGTFLLNNLIKYAKENNLFPLYLNAQINAIPFYQKFSFINEGEIFLEAGIKHQKMVYINH